MMYLTLFKTKDYHSIASCVKHELTLFSQQKWGHVHTYIIKSIRLDQTKFRYFNLAISIINNTENKIQKPLFLENALRRARTDDRLWTYCIQSWMRLKNFSYDTHIVCTYVCICWQRQMDKPCKKRSFFKMLQLTRGQSQNRNVLNVLLEGPKVNFQWHISSNLVVVALIYIHTQQKLLLQFSQQVLITYIILQPHVLLFHCPIRI